MEVVAGGKRLDAVTPSSLTAQEKLRYVQQQLQDETPRRQEAELQEPEEKQKPEAGLSWNGLGPAAMSQGCPGPPGSPDKPSQPHGLVPAGWGMGPRASEGPYVSEQELQKLLTGIEELRWAGLRGGASKTRSAGTQGWSLEEMRWAGPKGRGFSSS